MSLQKQKQENMHQSAIRLESNHTTSAAWWGGLHQGGSTHMGLLEVEAQGIVDIEECGAMGLVRGLGGVAVRERRFGE